MQSKGWIRFVAIMLAIASIWQLSFTAVTRIQEKKAAKYAEEQAQLFVEANNTAAEVREYVADSVANIRNRAYIDSISNEKVILRHIFAVALSDFLAHDPEVYNGNNADVLLNQDGRYQQ